MLPRFSGNGQSYLCLIFINISVQSSERSIELIFCINLNWDSSQTHNFINFFTVLAKIIVQYIYIVDIIFRFNGMFVTLRWGTTGNILLKIWNTKRRSQRNNTLLFSSSRNRVLTVGVGIIKALVMLWCCRHL